MNVSDLYAKQGRVVHIVYTGTTFFLSLFGAPLKNNILQNKIVGF